MTDPQHDVSLADFIRTNKAQILDAWLTAASALPSAQGLSVPLIRDHVPELLDKLAEAIERGDETALPMKGLPNLHAAIRVREGYDLRQVVAEYRALRRVIHTLYSEREQLLPEMRPELPPLRTMHAAHDAAISDAVDQFALDRDRAREVFIGMLGHDLRDPLQAINTGTRLLLKRAAALDEQAARIAARIGASARRMERLIDDLLDLARGRLSNGFTIVPARIDVRSMIDNTVDEIAHAHPERDIRSLAGSAPGDFAVTWDGDRVMQAVSNLVSNAIAHGMDPIVVEPQEHADHIVIEVRNRGEVDRAMLATLFAPFSGAHHDRRQAVLPALHDRRRGHLGLGLYIVSEIAKAHGGEVTAHSSGGETAVRLSLPRRVVLPETNPAREG
jgi:signal transduction histidine kinase